MRFSLTTLASGLVFVAAILISHTSSWAQSDNETGLSAPPSQAIGTPSPEATGLPAIEGLKANPASTAEIETLGSTEADSGYMFQAELTAWGAGVRYIRLSQFTQAYKDLSPYVIQQSLVIGDPDDPTARIYPFAARAVTVNGTRIELETLRWEVVEPGEYQITLVDGHDQPVLRITRRYLVQQGPTAYDLRCEQNFENLSDAPLEVQWEQYGQGDVTLDDGKYRGDQRKFVAGYHNLDYDPSGRHIYTDNTYITRVKVLDQVSQDQTPPLWVGKLDGFWPNEDLPANRQLVWVATLNRYFAAAVHPTTASDFGSPQGVGPTPQPRLDDQFPGLGIQVLGSPKNQKDPDTRVMAFTLTSRVIDIPAGDTASLDLSLYAGPRLNSVFKAQPYKSLNFAKLIVYEMGCALFTFQPLAKGLLDFLKGLHYITFDWAVSIIILVMLVRLVLHPLTKKSQVSMMKMGKQMQAVQPEIEKLKKKYKKDKSKFQQEQLKLFREKGINPANILGCLPLLLQTPIWVALYAMLYLAIELRHQPGFYGVFQAISSGGWNFLGDLSSPDNFVQFSHAIPIPLGFTELSFSSINILPLLMGVVFHYQQKLTTPPPANDQAAQQQKMMKFMIFLFPVMLYKAPSGLTLYILASTFAGIVDSYIVRQHIKAHEEAGTLFDKKEPKSGGFVDRMKKTMAAKQQEMLDKQQKLTGDKSRGHTKSQNKRRKKK